MRGSATIRRRTVAPRRPGLLRRGRLRPGQGARRERLEGDPPCSPSASSPTTSSSGRSTGSPTGRRSVPNATPGAPPLVRLDQPRPGRHHHLRAVAGHVLPVVLRLSNPYYQAVTGFNENVYVFNWLAVTGVLFAGSAVSTLSA